MNRPMTGDLLSVDDLTQDQVEELLVHAQGFRQDRRTEGQSASEGPLAGRSVALVFEKPSLRTRVSFEVAIHELGGHSVYLARDDIGMDSREPVEDVGRVLERWVAGIVARVFAHSTLVRLARAASVPVINGLSDAEHPCQALADLLTIRQRLNALRGVTVAYVGDPNNCAASLALACATVGVNFRIASPSGYRLSDALVTAARRRSGGRAALSVLSDAHEAVRGADVVYTDVWTSMGQEAEAAHRRDVFRPYRVDEELLGEAGPHAILMHPMPAHYGEEVPPDIFDHPQSVAYDQAENRLHMQKAVLQLLVTG